MSFGYTGGTNDYCCMDPASLPNYVFCPPNQPLLRPPLSSPTTVHSSLSNVHSHPKPLLPQPLAGADPVPKQMFENVFSGTNKNLHLSHFVHGKDMNSCLASLGHERVAAAAQHAQGVALSKDKNSSKQYSSLVSDIFSTDLQQHHANSEQHHQEQKWQNHENEALSNPLPQPKRKRNRKTKEPHQRKIKPAGTHLPREEIKRRRCRGDEYVTRTGKLISKKIFKMVDCKCRRNCSLKVPIEVRKRIFDEFHGMADWNSQTQFIVASVLVTDVKRKSKKMPHGEMETGYVSRRTTSRVFYLTSKKIQVCKPVFMSTLGITGKRVDYALRFKAIPLTAIATPDQRGKKQPKNKTSTATEERIKGHINSFSSADSGDGRVSSSSSSRTGTSCPAVPLSAPHFAAPSSSLHKSTATGTKASSAKSKTSGSKASSTQLHLPSDLTITKMYQLYQEQCEADGVPAASMWVYTKILHSESKFRSTSSHRGQNSQNTSSASCKCCDRSYAILMSGESPETIVQLLLDEHHQRLLGCSSFSSNSNPSGLPLFPSSTGGSTLSSNISMSTAFSTLSSNISMSTAGSTLSSNIAMKPLKNCDVLTQSQQQPL